MGLLKLGEKEHDLYILMFIGGHYLKCLRANALSVQCQVEFVEYMCVRMCVCVCVHRNNLCL
jgi:hypothetical protein